MPATSLALLMTDVVDSTRIAEALGEAGTAELWAAHDHAARQLLLTWRGREVDKTDGLLALFDHAADATGYALAYHAAMGRLNPPLSARAGIHVGPVVLRETHPDHLVLGAKRFEVDGLAKPVVARVMALARGGQTLLTQDARQVLGTPAGIAVRSHGHWRLKGLAEPMELFEAGDATSLFLPPPDESKAYRVTRQGGLWLPMRDVPHRMPIERNGFVGREEPLRDLAHKLDAGARMVSIVGMGGMGKTRFALRFAWSFLGDFPGGVWFCDLSPARTADGIHFAVAQGLDVPLGKTDAVVQLAHAIGGRGKCLVILDNFEQVARHAEATLGAWLDHAAQATFLVTSREVLGIAGEEVLALPPLAADDAKALFSHRAASAQRGFSPTPADEAAIAQLVTVLDGLPLAIELAAARVPVMGPRTLLARMNERFKVLSSRAGRHDRQATLRAAFDWSWELLGEVEKAALSELSVFEGGFTLASAEAVLGPSADDTKGAGGVDLVSSLVDKSFVRPLGNDRFDLLQSVRDYADEQLRTPGRYAGSGALASASAQDRHGRYFAQQATAALAASASADLENHVIACQRASARGDAETAVATLEGAWRTLELRGPVRLAIELSDAIGSLPTLSTLQRSRLDCVAGHALLLAGHIDLARERLSEACELARATGSKLQLALGLASLGAISQQEGQLDIGAERYRLALEIAEDLDLPSFTCSALNGLAHCQELAGHFKEARRGYEEVIKVARVAHDDRWIGGALGVASRVIISPPAVGR